MQQRRRQTVIDLTNRELASLVWIGVAAIAAVLWQPLRKSAIRAVAAVLRPVFLVPFALFGLYVAVLVALASLTPVWNLGLIKDTVLWFLTVGVVLMFRAVNAPKEEGWFLRQATGTVRLTLFLDIYLNFQGLPFWGEFALQGWLFVLILSDGAAQIDAIRGGEDLVGFARAIHFLQAVTGLVLMAYVAVWLFGNWATVDWVQSARELLLPVWLTLFSLPFIFGWAWYLTWEGARRQLRRFAPGGRIGLRSRLAVLLGYHLRLRDMSRFANYWARKVVEEQALRAKLRVVHEHRARMRTDEEGKRRRADELVRRAGYVGTDDSGRRMDRREFAETIWALETLSSGHMGWYRNEPSGRYKPKIVEFMPTYARGLPTEHGIAMEVAKDGQSWYAWRRTVSGWVFGIGAAGRPPDQRFYDGEVPPRGFPGPQGTWGKIPFERGPNWEA